MDVYLTTMDGALVANLGRQIGTARVTRRLPIGQYKLVLDNKFSMVTAKSVTPDVGIEYYKWRLRQELRKNG